MRHGKGCLQTKTTKGLSLYTGDFSEDQLLTGNSESNGKKYSGQFFNYKKHGEGELKWEDGRKYKGEFNNGKRHGYGVMK